MYFRTRYRKYMARAQFKAGCFTILLFGGGIWFFLGKPGFNEIKGYLPDLSKTKSQSTITKKRTSSKSAVSAGQVIDSYKGVNVHYNGAVSNVSGRNVTKDGYNLGLKYQCVEFAKRYYYERHGHKMPDSYGHARDFFDGRVPDGALNKTRGMLQYRNGGARKPLPEDLMVIGPLPENGYGHLMIVTASSQSEVSFIQQNPGRGNSSRGTYQLIQKNGGWYVDGKGIVGWLRMP